MLTSTEQSVNSDTVLQGFFAGVVAFVYTHIYMGVRSFSAVVLMRGVTVHLCEHFLPLQVLEMILVLV